MTVESGYLRRNTVQVTGLNTAGVYKVTPIQRPKDTNGRWLYDPYVYATVTVDATGKTTELRYENYGDFTKLRASNFYVTSSGVVGKNE